MSYLGMAPKATESLGQCAPKNEPGLLQNSTSDEAKKIAAAALAAVKDDAAASASSRGKLVVSTLLSSAPIFWSDANLTEVGKVCAISHKREENIYKKSKDGELKFVFLFTFQIQCEGKQNYIEEGCGIGLS